AEWDDLTFQFGPRTFLYADKDREGVSPRKMTKRRLSKGSKGSNHIKGVKPYICPFLHLPPCVTRFPATKSGFDRVSPHREGCLGQCLGTFSSFDSRLRQAHALNQRQLHY